MEEFKIGDKVRYREENTVIVAICDISHTPYIVEYSKGWVGSNMDRKVLEGILEKGKRYHHATTPMILISHKLEVINNYSIY